MSVTLVGLIGVAAMVVLLVLGVPIAFAMAVTGAVGLWILEGPGPALAHTVLIPWHEGRSFVLVTIPLFVLMGQLVFHTGLATDLYAGIRAWISRVPGGMAITSGGGVRRLWCGHRLQHCHRGDDGRDRDAGDAALQVPSSSGDRFSCGVWHAWHPDPAQPHLHLLRGDDRDVDRCALHCWHRSGHSDRGDVLGDHSGPVCRDPFARAARAGGDMGRTMGLDGRSPAHPVAVPSGDRRHLRWKSSRPPRRPG